MCELYFSSFSSRSSTPPSAPFRFALGPLFLCISLAPALFLCVCRVLWLPSAPSSFTADYKCSNALISCTYVYGFVKCDCGTRYMELATSHLALCSHYRTDLYNKKRMFRNFLMDHYVYDMGMMGIHPLAKYLSDTSVRPSDPS